MLWKSMRIRQIGFLIDISGVYFFPLNNKAPIYYSDFGDLIHRYDL